MRTNSVARIAAVLVALEGVGVVALAVWQVVALVSGDVASVGSALALLVLTLVGAAALLAFAVAISRDRSWGRSGGIVAQVLILAVALGAVTGEFTHPLIALALAAPAIAVLLLLIAAARGSASLHGPGGQD